ncbi:MAG: hypothetical protein F4150_08870 [Chloroflexi bacterium]|nr:hypothetical protein [Chloroflexota bacterium]
MSTLADFENRPQLARITCGWKKAELPLDWVRRYWRDVHSPVIARRPGIWDYRHSQFDPVRDDLLQPIEGIEFSCPAHQQLMWLSDVRYLDDDALAAWDAAPSPEVKGHLFGDIELIVDESTTYRTLGDNAHTYVDETGIATPQGPVPSPSYGIFLRSRADEASFRACLRELAARWAAVSGVLRLRLNLFEAPDMEAERRAGYPIKTHPPERQYQAWVDIVLASESVAADLSAAARECGLGTHVHTLHSYPVRVVYTSNYGGRPTLVGLRGYAAYEAITALGADNQRQPSLLEWMNGPVAAGGPVEDPAE